MKRNLLAPNTVLTIKPVQFGFNEEAFETNKFQQKIDTLSPKEIQNKALEEFNNYVYQLKQIGVNVIVYEDSLIPHTPDSIFPNNWISTHANGEVITYPMQPKNRRPERREDIVKELFEKFNYSVQIHLEKFENEKSPKYLEGTGSLIFDHQNKVVYAALSPRTDKDVLTELAKYIDYDVVSFTAFGSQKELIYHTNVMLCIGETFAIIGDQTIEETERENVIKSLIKGKKEVIQLSNKQVYEHFAGNMLQLRNNENKRVLVMSETAEKSLSKDQISKLYQHNDYLLAVPLEIIEKIGGGSARCMLAEIIIP